MKTLMLLRHAKSSWKDETLDDHERPLNKRGKRAAPLMGRLLKKEALVPDLIISSTAVRARRTAEAVAESSGYTRGVELDEGLYLAPAGKLLDVAARVPGDTVQRLLLVAHNPGMEDLVAMLSGASERFPTAALAVFELSVDRWPDVALGVETRLVSLFRP
ncbi:MAG TPA: histidine phosphatase family protein [Vicinamibacteria bacterium]|nr:histidine phosphatase family protein [Vicinamibacteria bacterium]